MHAAALLVHVLLHDTSAEHFSLKLVGHTVVALNNLRSPAFLLVVDLTGVQICRMVDHEKLPAQPSIVSACLQPLYAGTLN